MSNEQFEEGLEKQLENMLGFSPGKEAGNPSQATSVSSQAGEQVPPEEGKQQKKPGKKKKKGRRIALMILLPVAVLLCVYLVFAYQYQDKFFRGTIINGVDCGGMTVSQVEDRLEKLTEDYSLAITFRDGKTEKLQGDEIGYSYVSDGSVQEIKDRQVPIFWITGYFTQNVNEATAGASYDAAKLEKAVFSIDEIQETQMTAPQDAYVAWQEDGFAVVPEVAGNRLDREKLLQAVREAVAAGETKLDVEELGIYEEPSIKQDAEELVQQAEELNRLVSCSITYTLPSGNQVLDGSALKGWLVQDEQGRYRKDEDVWNQNIRQYVANMAAAVDTLHKDMTFHATGIDPVTVPNEVFGWQIDQEAEIAQLTSELQNSVVTVREPVYASRAVATENNGIGTTYVEIDLSRQHMWVYENGQLWMETDIVSGKMTHDRYTPPGVFQLYNKERERWLRGPKKEDGSYEWNAFVNYWMPFNEAIGMHDASWQYDFGGTYYVYGGSRGCINMPSDQAAKLYDWITVGIPVITYYSEDIEFID